MVRPKNAKVWNEDLKRALRAREEMARRQGKNSLNWNKGWKAIEAVRGDIYCFSNGRIANYPNTKLSKTVDALCRAIIEGTVDILPEGYIEPSLATQRTGNPYLNDPYCNRIKKRGGAFAILMAFHVSGEQIMTKEQICSLAQPFCDEEMESNYFAGRNRGAWAANRTLVNHDLLVTNRTAQYNERAGGMRSNGCWTYMITDNGKLFIEALLAKNPDVQNQIALARGEDASNVATRHDTVHFVPMASLPAVAFPSPPRSKKKAPTNVANDAKELREWVQSAQIGQQKLFKVGKDRRRYLHDLCDEINQSLRGRQLHHESLGGDARSRTLYVTLVSSHTNDDSMLPVKSSPSRPRSAGHLLGEGSPAKRPAVPARMAAAHAALERQAIQESSKSSAPSIAVTPEVVDLCDSDDDDFLSKPPPVNRKLPFESEKGIDDTKLPPVQLKAPPKAELSANAKSSYCVDLDSDSDDDIPESVLFKPKAPPKKLAAESKPIVNPYQTKKLKPAGQSMIICIDDRERNRNHTPRMMRMELTRLVSNGLLAAAWPIPLPKVEERRLESGDFCYIFPKVYGDADLPVLIERKRIGDLVQRSHQKDHWYQLKRMQNEVEERGGGTSFLLLEGDYRTVCQFTPYGSQDVEEFSPYNHAVDDEEALYRFFGRAVLNDRSRSTHFIHAKDEQGSLRMVGAIGLMLVTSSVRPTSQARIDSKLERQCVRDRLVKGGIPYQIADRISDEVSTTRNMNRLYEAIEDTGCRNQLFSAHLSDLALDASSKYSGSPLSWSTAVHKVWLSTLSDPCKGQELLNQYAHLVQDHAQLLALLHAGLSPDAALEEVLSSSPIVDEKTRSRTVEITVPNEYRSLFPDTPDQGDSKSSRSFCQIHTVNSTIKIPPIEMQTKCGPYMSSPLLVFPLDGSTFIERIQEVHGKHSGTDLHVVARMAAESLSQELEVGANLNNAADDSSRILLLRALNNAYDCSARRNGFRSETRILIDLVMAELMLAHKVVLLHALRLKDDRERVVQQLALSCFHYHLLDRTDTM